MKTIVWNSVCAAFVLASGQVCNAQVGKWPGIRASTAERMFVDKGEGGDTPLLLLVNDASGNAIYKLECHNGDYDAVAGFNFSGDFHCALFALQAGTVSSQNLLATGQEASVGRDWYNRGRMIADQLWQSCGSYAEYGVVRHFRLRGMLITFRFGGLEWFPFERFQRHRLKTFTFSVRLAPDAGAQAAIAESVGAAVPPKSCGW